MHDYQREFLDLALSRDALRFGRFTLVRVVKAPTSSTRGFSTMARRSRFSVVATL